MWSSPSPSLTPPSSSYAFSSPSSSSVSSSWHSIPSSPPPTSPLSYTSRSHVIEQHLSPGPYFAHMHARYDRGIGREHEKYWELEREGHSGYRKGKRIEHESRRDANRPSLPGIRELFGDLKPLRQPTSYSSSSSRSISRDSFWPVTPNSELPPIRSPERVTYSTTIPEHVFLSDEEDDYFRTVKPDSSQWDQVNSDDEEDGGFTFSFSPERRRSTTFETSSERGLWSSSPIDQRFHFPQRNSEPAPTSCSPLLPLSTVAAQASTPPPSTARNVSEPAPGLNSEPVGTFSELANSQSPPPRSPDARLVLSPLPPSSPPPLSPVSSLLPRVSRASSIPHFPNGAEPDSTPVVQDVKMELEPQLEQTGVVGPALSDGDSHEDVLSLRQTIKAAPDEATDIVDSEVTESLNVKQDDASESVEASILLSTEKVDTCPQSRDPPCSVNSPASKDIIMEDLTQNESRRDENKSAEAKSKQVSHLFDDDDDLLVNPTVESSSVMEAAKPNDVHSASASSMVPQEVEGAFVRKGEKEKQVLKTNTGLVNSHSRSHTNDSLSNSKSKELLKVTKRPLLTAHQQEPAKKKARISNTNGTPSIEKPRSGVQADTSFFTSSYMSSTSRSLKSSASGIRRPLPELASFQKKGQSLQVGKKSVTKPSVKNGKESEKKDRSEKQKERERPMLAKKKSGADEEESKKKKDVAKSHPKGKAVKRDGDESEDDQPSVKKTISKPKASSRKAKLVATSKPKSLRIVESDSESDSDAEVETSKRSTSVRMSSPLSSALSSSEDKSEEGEEEEEESVSEDSSSEEEEKILPRSRQRSKAQAYKSRPASKSKPKPKSKSKVPPPPPLPPLAPLDAELTGLIIETMAQSRASSHPVPTLYRSIMQTRPDALKGLVVHLSDPNINGEDGSEKRSLGEKEWSLELLRVMELGMERSGVFGKVESSAKDAERLLVAQWFYVPERDEDQERATLIKSIMPRPAKRNETKKYKQYYWKPLGKTLRWDAVDGI